MGRVGVFRSSRVVIEGGAPHICMIGVDVSTRTVAMICVSGSSQCTCVHMPAYMSLCVHSPHTSSPLPHWTPQSTLTLACFFLDAARLCPPSTVPPHTVPSHKCAPLLHTETRPSLSMRRVPQSHTQNQVVTQHRRPARPPLMFAWWFRSSGESIVEYPSHTTPPYTPP